MHFIHNILSITNFLTSYTHKFQNVVWIVTLKGEKEKKKILPKAIVSNLLLHRISLAYSDYEGEYTHLILENLYLDEIIQIEAIWGETNIIANENICDRNEEKMGQFYKCFFCDWGWEDENVTFPHFF